MPLDPNEVKAESEQLILTAGGKINDELPPLARSAMRTRDQIVARALVMNAMMQIYFDAPIEVIDGWIYDHGLTDHVSPAENEILSKRTEDLLHKEKTDLYWYIEGVWTLMWVGHLIDSLPFDRGVENFFAALAPDLQNNEDGTKFQSTMRIRPFPDLFKMLDLYYRLHWYTRDGLLHEYDTGNFRHDRIMERRRALEWVLQPSVGWDDARLLS